ncbi:unnamed protein product [Paramecium primaurelia]|uniref:Uncharacterized protein n=1 Tax=Paramecium primaurelia TaxID=5886 RepID=A0A8S1K0P4_PARPR|nr:unnamed protein product [Paramecium primaurelia]
MNSFVYSFKNPSSEFVESANFVQNKRPNQFCLKIFNQQSYEDFKLEDQLQQPLQQQSQDQYPQLSISQYFLNPQLSLELKSKFPSLDKYIKKKKIHKKAKQQSAAIRDYKKNICRNILRHGIKGINNTLAQLFLLEKFRNNNQKLIEFQRFYQQNLEIISGFRVLKDHLIIQVGEPKEEQERKRIFQQYLIWFLSSQATKCILQSEANNIAEYVKYKNDVLLYYVQQPSQWYSNKPLWRQKNELI